MPDESWNLTDTAYTADALLLAGAKSASDGLDTAEAFAWQGGVVLTDNVYTVDAFAVFERVIWKLTLGRW